MNFLRLLLVNVFIALTSIFIFRIFEVPEYIGRFYFWLLGCFVVFILANWRFRLKCKWLLSFVFFIFGMAFFIRTPIVSGYVVSEVFDRSNEPVLNFGDLVISRANPNYERGAFVVFNYGLNKYRKRIVGIPGDVVEVCQFDVIVNGFHVESLEYHVNFNENYQCLFEPKIYYLQDDEFFLIGVSDDSLDSRSYGPINRESILYYSVFVISDEGNFSIKPKNKFSLLDK